MGRLTTHVLDTALGKPAANLLVELFIIEGETKRKLAQARTNADGRAPKPLLEGEAFRPGIYELLFHAGIYLDARSGHSLPEPKFVDMIPIRFGIADGDAHYHVPLLLAPFGYSTYRGS